MAVQPGLESQTAPAPSTLMGAAVSFATSMARFAASGFKTVDEPLHQLRMSHCQPCGYRNDSQCSLCRCFIAKGVAAARGLPHRKMALLVGWGREAGDVRRGAVGSTILPIAAPAIPCSLGLLKSET